eukprot:sb/3466913/
MARNQLQRGADFADSTAATLNTFIRSEEQSLSDISNMFPTVGQIRGDVNEGDAGVFSVISTSIPRGANTESFTNSGIQCLDMMLNHLQSREVALERSPEYSVDLSLDNQLVELGRALASNLGIGNDMDNRFQPSSDTSENCSSEQPDNDRRAEQQFQITDTGDEIEVIDLESTPSSRGMDRILDDSIHHVRVDNFVSSVVTYDSDKDIDETEVEEETGYIPSFHSPPPPPTLSSLPGQPTEESEVTETVIMTRDAPENNNNGGSEGENYNSESADSDGNQSSESGDSEPNNDVTPFAIDSNFNYEHIRTTPRMSHFR